MVVSALKKITGGIDVLVKYSGMLAALLMPVLALVIAIEVFCRFVLNSPTIWAYDLSLFLFGYIAALGGAWAQQKRSHINVDILYLQVPHKVRSVFNLISYTLGIFFLVLIFKMSVGKYEEAIEFNYRRQSEWAPPMFHFWIMACVAAGLFVLQLARDMLHELIYLLTGKTLSEVQPDVEH